MGTKQTAVQWLEEQVIDNKDIYIKGNTLMIPNDIFRKAKQMEKEQICDAWENGFMDSAEGWNGEIPPECHGQVLDTEEYYNETYGK